MKTVGIMTYRVPSLKPWDPDTIRTGITGSEEAVIYISQKLAKLGLKVTVFADPPKGSIHSHPNANPRFVNLEFQPQKPLDAVVSWRMPHIGHSLRRLGRRVYFWPADIIDRRLPQEMILAFDDVLWLSQWQRSQWISMNPGFGRFTHIFGNGINPEEFTLPSDRENPYSCIYGSNYARGLEILLAIWPAIKSHYPRATLDLYYGWQTWGCLSPEKEDKMRKLLTTLQDVQDHGLIGHAELNCAYGNASFWTYPCIMPETFCTTAIRAQMGGAIPVIIDGSALKETVRYGFRCDRSENYLATLLQAMRKAETITIEERQKMRDWILREYTWETMAKRWKELFGF
jgi:glycosyltransferase involved in cell wall biosynthesis